MKKVKKRDGRYVVFDPEKIKNAILKAFVDVDGELSDYAITKAENIAQHIEEIANMKELSIEEIQDMVEEGLARTKRKDVAKSYILYREERSRYRNIDTTLKKKYQQLSQLLNGTDEESKTENSNKDTRIIPTMRDYIAGFTCRELADNFLLPREIADAHKEGIIHFHDSDYSPTMPMTNCFDGGTYFISNKGVKAFRDFFDGEELLVPTHTGEWKKAIVKKYGKQPLNEITLKRGPWTTKTFYATNNHRWILKNGEFTTSLKVGDYLLQTPCINEYDWESLTIEQKKMWCYGFAYGDGSNYSTNKGMSTSCRIRLCKKKNQYVNYFLDAGYNVTQPSWLKGEHTVCIPGYDKNTLPTNLFNDFINIKVFVHGLLCADGKHTTNKNSSNDFRGIQVTGKEKIRDIRQLLEIAGYYISNEKNHNDQTTNYGKRTDDTINFSFQAKQTYRNWRVTDIRATGLIEDVWCLEVEDNHSFILSGGIVTGNCCLINLEDMLQNGTVISGILIEKPHSFQTACTVATQIITQVASSQYGGNTINIGHLAPFVQESRIHLRKKFPQLSDNIIEQLVQKEIKDGIQTIQYQLITMSTTNGQAPFTSLSLWVQEFDDPVLQADLALIIKEIFLQRIEGVKNEQGIPITTAFPKLLYVLDTENSDENGKYWYLTQLAAECSARRLVPDYISAKIMRKLKGAVYPCMGCRSFLTPDSVQQKYWGRFNQGVVTLNLVDVACSAKDEDDFWDILNDRLTLCKQALMIRHNSLKGTKSDVAPILWQHGAYARLKQGETIDSLLYNNYSTISLGYAGLWECVYKMTKKKLIEEEGLAFGKKVLQKLNDACEIWKKETNISFSVYGSPIESTTYKFAKCLKRRFGEIRGVTDKDYITNSYHITPSEPIDAFSKLKIEAELQELSPGGAISYIEVPNMTKNISALLEVIKYIYNTIMYAEINTMTSYCKKCGCTDIHMQKDLTFLCPQCGNNKFEDMNIALRICGYISTNPFNKGRAADIYDRVSHLDDEKIY